MANRQRILPLENGMIVGTLPMLCKVLERIVSSHHVSDGCILYSAEFKCKRFSSVQVRNVQLCSIKEGSAVVK